MSNNTTLNPGSGGDPITTVDLTSFSAFPSTGKLPAECLYVNAAGTGKPTPVSNSNPMPTLDVAAQDQWALAQSSNSTTVGTTFTALAPTTTAPSASSSRAVITLAGRSALLLQFFGKNANNLSFKARISGWAQASGLWTSTPLCEVTVTLSSSLPGVAAATVDNTNLFADTVALSGATGVGVVYTSPADDTGIATLEVPICGPFSFAEIQFIRNASATECNALVKTF